MPDMNSLMAMLGGGGGGGGDMGMGIPPVANPEEAFAEQLIQLQVSCASAHAWSVRAVQVCSQHLCSACWHSPRAQVSFLCRAWDSLIARPTSGPCRPQGAM